MFPKKENVIKPDFIFHLIKILENFLITSAFKILIWYCAHQENIELGLHITRSTLNLNNVYLIFKNLSVSVSRF